MPQPLKQALIVACIAFVVCAPPVLKAAPAMAPNSANASTQPQILATNDPRNRLHLTPDQQKKVMAIVHQYTVDSDKIINTASLSNDQKKKKVEALQTAAQGRFDALLTPEQLGLEKAHRARVKEIGALGEQYNQLKGKLVATLTPAQRKQLEAIDAATKQQGNQIEVNKSLTDAQKHEQITSLMKEYTQKENQVYNASQRQIVAQMIQLSSKGSTLAQQP